MRLFFVALSMALFGVARLPVERAMAAAQQGSHLRAFNVDDLELRERIGQFSFIAALSGLRSVIADALFIQAHVAWERTEWGRVLFLFRQVTTLQPRVVLFWDMAAWHMAWNAATAALNDSTQPELALRVRAQREYLQIGKDFLERGIKNNPDRPELYEAMARLYRDKYDDHERAAEFFAKAAAQPKAPGYLKRFAGYELAQCHGREWEAYRHLHALYLAGKEERLPTLIRHLKELELKLAIPSDQRLPEKESESLNR